MDRLSLETQTLYAELQDQLTALEAQRSIGSLPGGFTTKSVKGETYYYFQYSSPGSQRQQVYVGKESSALKRLVDQYQTEKVAFQADQRSIQRLCAQLQAGGAIVAPHAHYRVLQSLADAGVFRMGGVLVGTHAFLAMGNPLGCRWETAGTQTQDVDIAGDRALALALPDVPAADVPGALERLEMGFFPVPELDPRSPSTSYKVRNNPLRVDVLTPAKSRDEEYQAVTIPKFQAAAQALRYLDYLIENPLQVALISGKGGVMANIPNPARYAFHKLIVMQERPASEHVKRNKDLRQASLLINLLAAERPGDIRLAWDELVKRGEPWVKRATRGYAEMRKIFPEIPSLEEII
jgi:hypothetical protein